jgi:hypothetical protein
MMCTMRCISRNRVASSV